MSRKTPTHFSPFATTNAVASMVSVALSLGFEIDHEK